jgi:hypothetical protein
MLRLVCSVALSAEPGAVTTGASLIAVMLIVWLAVPSSELPSPLIPGSVPVLPWSLTVRVMVVFADGVSELFR